GVPSSASTFRRAPSGGVGSVGQVNTSGSSFPIQCPGSARTVLMNSSRRAGGTWYSTDVWKTTKVASAGACAASAGRSSTRSPRTSKGGSAAAMAAAARRRGGGGRARPCPPHPLGQAGGQCQAGGRAVQDRIACADPVAVVAVAVAVRVEAQTGRRADVQQREGLRQGGEHWHA